MNNLAQIVDSFLEMAQSLVNDGVTPLSHHQRPALAVELDYTLDFLLARHLEVSRLPLDCFEDLKRGVVQASLQSLPESQPPSSFVGSSAPSVLRGLVGLL